MAQQQDFAKLSSQGRAFDATRAWTEDELAALLALESECDLARNVAAEYVRNGIMSPAQYRKAVELGFAPKSLEDLRAEAIAAHQKQTREIFGEVTEAEEVVEPEVVVEPEAVVSEEVVAEEVVEPEVVVEPEAEVESSKVSGKKKK